LWFDHHYTNKIDKPFRGVFRDAPSASRIIYEYYREKFTRDYSRLVQETDRIDSANLSLEEVLYPERYAYILLSMTINNQNEPDENYWNLLVELIRKFEIEKILADPAVKKRCGRVVAENRAYKTVLRQYTELKQHVAITDFRSFDIVPTGNRFLVYSLYPRIFVHVRIRYDAKNKDKVVVNIGHSIFNRNCRVNVGLLLAKFEGGGHPGAGSCRFHKSKADDYLPQIIDVLLKNESNEA
jgi:oligoribonuclease NrnB/cAMP/cGMP phosphodiesterase (DHH superfamily)